MASKIPTKCLRSNHIADFDDDLDHGNLMIVVTLIIRLLRDHDNYDDDDYDDQREFSPLFDVLVFIIAPSLRAPIHHRNQVNNVNNHNL